MSPQKPIFQNQISLGNLLQILVLVVGLAASYVVMDTRSKNNSENLQKVSTQLVSLELRLRKVEVDQARTDERFQSILTVLSSIDKRMEQFESRN